MRRPHSGEVRVRVSEVGTMIAAVIEDVGSTAEGFVRGDRVVYPRSLGEDQILKVDLLVGIPKNVSDQQAAELLGPGLVSYALLTQVRPFAKGERVCLAFSNAILKPVVAAWVTFRGGVLVDDETDADVVYTEIDCKRAGHLASHRQGRLQQTATEVFQAIRAGSFDDLVPHKAQTREQAA
ncbi:MAG: hypothetical protein IT191_08115 [Microbacteriaceae bacterium]|nr:hypothetical protein [Cryobacterium sp.]MCC6376969.1 hypothetical protein [Microbacteriaceae bacterium]